MNYYRTAHRENPCNPPTLVIFFTSTFTEKEKKLLKVDFHQRVRSAINMKVDKGGHRHAKPDFLITNILKDIIT